MGSGRSDVQVGLNCESGASLAPKSTCLLRDGGNAAAGADRVVVEPSPSCGVDRGHPFRDERGDERAARAVDVPALVLADAAPAVITATTATSAAAARQGQSERACRFSASDFPPPQGFAGNVWRGARRVGYPPLRGGDEVVTGAGAPPRKQLVRWFPMSIDTALEQIEAQLQEMGQRVLSAVHGAMRALEERDRELAARGDRVRRRGRQPLPRHRAVDPGAARAADAGRPRPAAAARDDPHQPPARAERRRVRDDRQAVAARRRRRAGSGARRRADRDGRAGRGDAARRARLLQPAAISPAPRASSSSTS